MVTPSGFFPFPHEKRFSKNILIAVVMITVMAMGLRLGYVSVTTVLSPIRADAQQYIDYAHNLVRHGTFSLQSGEGVPIPDSYRSPGYPAFISLIMLLAKEHTYRALQCAQAVLGGLMVPMTYCLGTFFLPVWGALVACFFVALSPHLVTSTSYVLTETLFGFLLLAGLLSLFLTLHKPTRSHCLYTGICFGAAYLTNEATLLVVIAVCAVAAINTEKTLRGSLVHGRSRRLLLVLAVFLVFPISWSVRNQVNVSPTSPQGKDRVLITLTHGTYPDFVYKDPQFKYYPYKEDPRQPEYSRSFDSFLKIFSERFRQRPLRFAVWYAIEKPYYLWSWNILQGQGDVYIYPVQNSLYQLNKVADMTRVVMKYLHPVILLLSLISVVLLFFAERKKKLECCGQEGSKILLSLLLVFTFIYAVFVSWPRYSIPLRPELYLCACWSLASLLSLFRSSNDKPS